MSIRSLSSILITATVFACTGPAHAAPTGTFITVGSDAACTYSNLTAATFADASIPNIYIRVAKNIAPALHTLPGRQMTIEGGYDNCSDTTPSGRTVIAGDGALGSVLWLTAGYSGSTSHLVTLTNLEIRGGVGGTNKGGGMTIQGPFNVTLANTAVRNNSSVPLGGGILLKGSPGVAGEFELTRLQLTNNTFVGVNQAPSGGGIACEGKVSIKSYDAAVSSNTASDDGGGIHSDGCHLLIYDHGLSQGVVFNIGSGSLSRGGGIYAVDSNIYLRGGSARPVQISANTASRGGGIYVLNSGLYAFDSEIIANTAVFGGGVYANGSTTVIARTRSRTSCHDALRCSKLSDNTSTSAASNSSTGGGGLFAIGGTTRISGTFIERNRAFSGRGMAVAALNAQGTNGGLDRNGMQVLGSVIARSNSGGTGTPADGSVVEMKGTSGAVGFSTFSRNLAVPNIVYTPTSSVLYSTAVYGSIFDSTTGNAAGGGATGWDPLGDCNRLHESSSSFAMNSTRSTEITPQFVDAANEDYRLGGLNLVDWCDESFNYLPTAISADGGPRPEDDPGITALHGNYDLGGLERHQLVLADLIFQDGFED